MVCGKPAAYVGRIQSVSIEGRKEYPFCEGCTKTPNKWHRQFLSNRPAVEGETCAAPEGFVVAGEESLGGRR